ncbi:30S ribosomal protein S6 [Candidatus Uhrbacteria bacterium]|nr:30S ribosomal protein S6 [Candidatus Uhrbacteria bacterium]
MKYELLYIIPATKTDEEVLKVKDEVTALITKYGEECLRDESLGKKKLAYPIEGVRYGHYVLVCFAAEPDQILAFDEEMRHSNDVLRHMITTAIAGAEKLKVELVEYEAPDTMQKRRPPTKKADAPRKKEMTEEEAIAKTENASVTDEQLEKKLDEILESDIDKA